MDKKPLFVAAYRGEIQHFFLKVSYARLNNSPLYESRGHYLCISGGGANNVITSLAPVINNFTQKISLVINLGIAGTLNTGKANIDQIYHITNVCRKDPSGNIQTLLVDKDLKSGFTCISSAEPIDTEEKASRLRPIADIVDREAWDIVNLASHMHLPVRVYKYISDIPGKQSYQEIIDSAPKFSEKLYTYINDIHTIG